MKSTKEIRGINGAVLEGFTHRIFRRRDIDFKYNDKGNLIYPGSRLLRIREYFGLTQEKFSLVLSVSERQLRRYETFSSEITSAPLVEYLYFLEFYCRTNSKDNPKVVELISGCYLLGFWDTSFLLLSYIYDFFKFVDGDLEGFDFEDRWGFLPDINDYKFSEGL